MALDPQSIIYSAGRRQGNGSGADASEDLGEERICYQFPASGQQKEDKRIPEEQRELLLSTEAEFG